MLPVRSCKLKKNCKSVVQCGANSSFQSKVNHSHTNASRLLRLKVQSKINRVAASIAVYTFRLLASALHLARKCFATQLHRHKFGEFMVARRIFSRRGKVEWPHATRG